MPAEIVRKNTPPYISPVTFHHLLEQLQNHPTDRIDRSYLTTLHSGGTSSQILSALRYMGLVDGNGKPTTKLNLLVKAPTQEDRTRYFNDIVVASYSFIVSNNRIDLTTATYQQIEEVFTHSCGVDGDVRRKCIKFFTGLAKDAGIRVSDQVGGRMRTGRGTVPKALVKRSNSKPVKPVEIPRLTAPVPYQALLLEKLVEKFPPMDVTWNAETKQRWLDSFSQLMIQIYGESPQEDHK